MANESEDNDVQEVIVQWSAIYVTFLVALLQSTVFYLFFLYQRSVHAQANYHSLYEPRSQYRPQRTPQPFSSPWYQSVMHTSQEELLRCVGLDSYMFLRFFRMGARIAGVGTVLSVVLIPLYATGNNVASEGFNQWTLARVEDQAWRLWGSVVSWWIFIGFALRELWAEWKLFSINRYAFLSKGDPETPISFRYSILIEQIPPHLTTPSNLTAYFNRLFPNKVRHAIVYLQADALNQLVDERQLMIEEIEKAVAFEKAYPDEPTQKVNAGSKFCGKYDGVEELIPHLHQELNYLNDQIDVMRDRIQAESAVTTDMEDTLAVLGEVHLNALPEDRVAPVSSTGIITFSSLFVKQCAVQCEINGKADWMTVSPAADPNGILWNNATMPLGRQTIIRVQQACLWIILALFWAIPAIFVTSLANLNSIVDALNIDSVDSTTSSYILIEGLLPVIFLALFMLILHLVIRNVATHWIKLKSMPEVDAYTLYWYQLFHFANLWFILLGGSFFNQLQPLFENQNVNEFLMTVTKALPGASTQFFNMIVFMGLGMFGLELSMLPKYGISLLKNMIQPEAQRTQRMLDEAKKPPVILWGRKIPPAIFVFLVAIVYMPIVPLIEVYALIFFAGSYVVWKHQCLHVYSQSFEGGGTTTWEGLFGFLMASLYMGEGIFISYMGIKKAWLQSSCGFVPLVASILVHMTINRNIRRPLNNLSLEIAADIDATDGELKEEYDNEIKQVYEQPGLEGKGEERGPMPFRRERISFSGP